MPISEKRQGDLAIGIDMGITTLAMLSSGEAIPNPQVARSAEKAMRVHQRALARCRRGSNRRQKVRERLARLHLRIASTRRTGLNQVSARIVCYYDLIAIEKLTVNGLAGGMFAREVRDAGWPMLTDMLRYKAERAGALLVRVDCRHTSQDCSACGERVKKTLKERIHHCPSCALVLDGDVNAARNILQRGCSGSRASQRKAAA